MPEKFLLFMVAVLLILGGVYEFRGSFPTLLRGRTPELKQQSPRPAAVAPQPRPAQPKRASRSQPLIAASAIDGPKMAAADIAAPKRARAYPSDIPASLSLPDLIQKFGEPDLAASWTSGGKLNRKLIYASDGKTLEVNVQNGRVVSKGD